VKKKRIKKEYCNKKKQENKNKNEKKEKNNNNEKKEEEDNERATESNVQDDNNEFFDNSFKSDDYDNIPFSSQQDNEEEHNEEKEPELPVDFDILEKNPDLEEQLERTTQIFEPRKNQYTTQISKKISPISSCDEVFEVLSHCNDLKQFASTFRDNKIDGTIFELLTREDMEKMGVNLIGDQVRLRSFAQQKKRVIWRIKCQCGV